MLLLGVMGLSLLIGVLRGGRLTALGAHHWHAASLPFLAIGMQIVAFLPDESASAGARALAAWLHVTSYLLTLTFVWLNRQTPWMSLVGLGLAANAAVIITNGGFMPVASGVLLPGTPEVEAGQREIVNNVMAMGARTSLRFLGDVIRTPEWLGRRAFSLGDLAIAVGAFALVQRMMRPAATAPPGGAT